MEIILSISSVIGTVLFFLLKVLVVAVISLVVSVVFFKCIEAIWGAYITEGTGFLFLFIVAWILCYTITKEVLHIPVAGWVVGSWPIPVGILFAAQVCCRNALYPDLRVFDQDLESAD